MKSQVDGLEAYEFLWFPGMTDGELEAWWMALKDVETFWKTEQVSKTRLRPGWPGEFIEADKHELFRLCSELWDSAPYVSFIDMNDPNTYLKRRDGVIFVHRGAYSTNDK